MAPRATRRAVAAAAAQTMSSARQEVAKSKSEVQQANPQPEHGDDDGAGAGASKEATKPVTTEEAKQKSLPSTTLLPPSLNLGSKAIKFTSFTVSSTASAKSKKSGKEIPCLRSHQAPHPTSLIFTHGAGGDLSAAAMVNFAQGFASTGAAIVMFQGNMNLTGRAGLFGLVKKYELEHGSLPSPDDEGDTAGKKRKIEAQQPSVAFGGRSMGARAAVVASHTDSEVKALVLASYPLVGPGGDVRDKILLDVAADVDVLFIGGDSDSMCPLARLEAVRAQMKAHTWRVVLQGADHGLNIRGGKKLKDGTERLGKESGRMAAEWLRERDPDTREMSLRWDGETGRVLGGKWVGSETGPKAKKEVDDAADEEGGGEAERDGGKSKRTKK